VSARLFSGVGCTARPDHEARALVGSIRMEEGCLMTYVREDGGGVACQCAGLAGLRSFAEPQDDNAGRAEGEQMDAR